MKLSYEQLKQNTEELSVSVKNIKEILNNTREISNRIISSECWTGKASDYYVSKLSKFTENFDDVNQSLEKAVIYLEKVLERYENVDTAISHSINN